jgi:hypothetical protein
MFHRKRRDRLVKADYALPRWGASMLRPYLDANLLAFLLVSRIV